jgi:hypothetical protein
LLWATRAGNSSNNWPITRGLYRLEWVEEDIVTGVGEDVELTRLFPEDQRND